MELLMLEEAERAKELVEAVLAEAEKLVLVELLPVEEVEAPSKLAKVLAAVERADEIVETLAAAVKAEELVLAELLLPVDVEERVEEPEGRTTRELEKEKIKETYRAGSSSPLPSLF
jgi:hypothetical protein